VKSVQRGVANKSITSTGSFQDININFSSIDASKSMVLVEMAGDHVGAGSYYLKNVTSTSLTIAFDKGVSGTSSFYISWQVIEFY